MLGLAALGTRPIGASFITPTGTPTAPGAATAPVTLTGSGSISGGASSLEQGQTPRVLMAGFGAITGSADGSNPAVLYDMTGARSAARVFRVSEPQTGLGSGSFWDLANPAKPKGVKDPDAVIDVTFDWSDWFADADDAYGRHDIILGGGLVLIATGEQNGAISPFVAGGTVGALAPVTCRVHSTSTPPRVDERTVYLKIKNR